MFGVIDLVCKSIIAITYVAIALLFGCGNNEEEKKKPIGYVSEIDKGNAKLKLLCSLEDRAPADDAQISDLTTKLGRDCVYYVNMQEAKLEAERRSAEEYAERENKKKEIALDLLCRKKGKSEMEQAAMFELMGKLGRLCF